VTRARVTGGLQSNGSARDANLDLVLFSKNTSALGSGPWRGAVINSCRVFNNALTIPVCNGRQSDLELPTISHITYVRLISSAAVNARVWDKLLFEVGVCGTASGSEQVLKFKSPGRSEVGRSFYDNGFWASIAPMGIRVLACVPEGSATGHCLL